MRAVLMLGAALVLAACDPTVPDSAAGVGFDGYTGYAADRAQRDAQLAGGFQPQGGVISVETTGPADDGDAVAAETLTALAATGEQAQPPVEIDTNNAGISDENSFEAVSSRESIAENAAKIAAQKEAYQVIQPGALPSRAGIKDGATLVEFALASTNSVGQTIYPRTKIASQSRYERGCAKYASPDLAQEAFLDRGGPQRDPMGIDPDGDGFACTWDPRPFRLAAGR